MSRAILAFAMLAALVAGPSCSPGGSDRANPAPPAGNSVGEAMSDDVFDKVELGTFDSSAGTPKVEDDFSGIRIAMPSKVSAGALPRLPLCGVWTFDGGSAGRLPRIEDSLVYLVRNVATNETATGNFRIHKDPVTAA
ncbi:hypothetical protein, partial [Nitrospira sp. BLG_2]|uniref:hypothetical protein n=1 Tax=Nitrospira sp. BLG_2 TaxID=3397507 RepID=UPI003B9965F5